MKKRKKVLLFIIFGTLDLILITAILIVRDATSLNNLTKEVEELSKLDLTSDRYNRKIRTSGGYAIVERSIKNYFDDFALGIEDITDLVTEDEFINILSYDNYEKDGPEFKKSLKYIEKNKEKFNNKIDKMIEKIDSKYVESYIDGKTINSYYISLYNKFMNSDNINIKLHQLKELLKKTKTRVNETYDISYDVLIFLKTYKDDWELEDGEIKFRTDDLYKYYTDLVSKVEKRDD